MKDKKVAYLGPAGTFTEKLARKLFPSSELIPYSLNRKVIFETDVGNADFGVVPIENFYNGEVRETLDALRKAKNAQIVAERSLAIVHCFGALHGAKNIEQILSKDQALEQCGEFLTENYPHAEIMAVPSTAYASEFISREHLMNAAAISSEEAIKQNGLELIAKDICPNNRTKFIVIGKEDNDPTENDKTFIAVHPQIRDKPGVLRDILGIFAALNINLECIQSRPDGKKGYYFYMELDGHKKDPSVRLALEAVSLSIDPKREYSDTIKILGSYADTRWKDED